MNKITIASIAEINPPLPKYVENEDTVSFITMADVSENGRLFRKDTKFFRDVKSGFTRFAENDVLFAKITPCMENGKGALVRNLHNGIGCGSTEFHVLRAKHNNSSAFIYQVTRDIDFRVKAEMKMTGSAGQRRVPASFFYEHLIYIPSPAHQRKIARILTTVDKIIEKTESSIEKYKAIKQGMMHDLFTRGIDVKTGKLRPCFEDAPELYKKTELGMVPKGWGLRKIREIGEVVTGNTPSTTNTSFYGNEFLFISPADICNNKYLVNTENHLSGLGLKISRRIPPYSICIVCIGSTIGKIAINTIECATNQQINTVIPVESDLSEYFYYSIKAFVLKQLYIEAGLQAVPIVNKSTFEKLLTAIPNNNIESKQISTKLKKADSFIEYLIRENDKRKKLKQGLMQDLLTGKKEVTPDPEDFETMNNE